MGHPAVQHLADEVAEHLLGHLEVGDHPVAQRPRGRDRRRRAADHPLGVGPDGVDLPGVDVGGDHRGLGDHDPAPAHVHERVRGTEIDRDVMDPEARGQVAAGIVVAGAVSTKADPDRLPKSEQTRAQARE